MTNTSLNFTDVTFGFEKGQPLFEKLTLTLQKTPRKGKIIALMGPSGVGKTTFCDLALGILRPVNGKITFGPPKAKIAVIPQKAVLFEELSVQENISCLKYSESVGKSFKKEKVEQAVQSLKLANVLLDATKVSSLSGGEAQRVMLARIQTIDCDVLFLDEPCSFLDNRMKQAFLDALRTTVDESDLLAFMVTHVWDEAQVVADQVVFFHQTMKKSVSLYTCSIDEAQISPPTIDSFYSIYWPACFVLDLNKKTSKKDILENNIPSNTRYIGFYSSVHSQTICNEWANEIWKEAENQPHVNHRHIYNIIDHDISNGISAIFYDHNGVLIRTEK